MKAPACCKREQNLAKQTITTSTKWTRSPQNSQQNNELQQ